MRVISIFLARAISCSRVSSGISPICVRYIRTGSSMRLLEASASSSSRLRSRSSSSSLPSASIFSSSSSFLAGMGAGATGGNAHRRRRRRRNLWLAALLELADVRLIDEPDAHLIDHHQQRVELVRRDQLVRQTFVEFFVGEIRSWISPCRSARARGDRLLPGSQTQLRVFRSMT